MLAMRRYSTIDVLLTTANSELGLLGSSLLHQILIVSLFPTALLILYLVVFATESGH